MARNTGPLGRHRVRNYRARTVEEILRRSGTRCLRSNKGRAYLETDSEDTAVKHDFFLYENDEENEDDDDFPPSW